MTFPACSRASPTLRPPRPGPLHRLPRQPDRGEHPVSLRQQQQQQRRRAIRCARLLRRLVWGGRGILPAGLLAVLRPRLAENTAVGRRAAALLPRPAALAAGDKRVGQLVLLLLRRSQAEQARLAPGAGHPASGARLRALERSSRRRRRCCCSRSRAELRLRRVLRLRRLGRLAVVQPLVQPLVQPQPTLVLEHLRGVHGHEPGLARRPRLRPAPALLRRPVERRGVARVQCGAWRGAQRAGCVPRAAQQRRELRLWLRQHWRRRQWAWRGGVGPRERRIRSRDDDGGFELGGCVDGELRGGARAQEAQRQLAAAACLLIG